MLELIIEVVVTDWFNIEILWILLDFDLERIVNFDKSKSLFRMMSDGCVSRI